LERESRVESRESRAESRERARERGIWNERMNQQRKEKLRKEGNPNINLRALALHDEQHRERKKERRGGLM
jgi:hypothetical protein